MKTKHIGVHPPATYVSPHFLTHSRTRATHPATNSGISLPSYSQKVQIRRGMALSTALLKWTEGDDVEEGAAGCNMVSCDRLSSFTASTESNSRKSILSDAPAQGCRGGCRAAKAAEEPQPHKRYRCARTPQYGSAFSSLKRTHKRPALSIVTSAIEFRLPRIARLTLSVCARLCAQDQMGYLTIAPIYTPLLFYVSIALTPKLFRA